MVAETNLLSALQGRLPLPIPHPIYTRFDPPIPGLAFVGYRRLPGQPLLPAGLAAVRNEFVRDDLARQLAEFLRALHNLPLANLPADLPGCPPGQPPGEQRATWESMYAAVREKLFAAMRPDARRAVSALFESYLDDSSLHNFEPCLRHGDFGGDNILWQPPAEGSPNNSGAQVTAILDFTCCAPGDPAYDLASVATLGADLFERLALRYAPDPTHRAGLLARVRFYQGTFALEEALSGLEDGDTQAYARGMENYL
jgi:aminoglycoside 2''-phosphotransferase